MNATIICLIYKSTGYLQFVYDQVKKYTDLTTNEFYFVANDATSEVISYLSTNNLPHYIFNNTPENILAHGTTECFINNVYRAYNFGITQAKGKYLVLINSDMGFSPFWLENLMKNMTPNVCLTSRLVESGRYPSGQYGITYNCGKTMSEYDEAKFLNYINTITNPAVLEGGLYGPLLILKEHFIKVGMYPEGNIVPGSDIFNPIIAKKGAQCISGDKILMEKLKTIGVKHMTVFNSIVYHFQSGEMLS